MINLKSLLTKICENISILKTWRTTAETDITTLFGNATGTVISNSFSSNKSIPDNDWTEVLNITLTPGTWLVQGRVSFAHNTTGYRAATITSRTADQGPATTNAAVVQDPVTNNSTGTTFITLPMSVTNISENTVERLLVKHTRGSALNATGGGLIGIKIAEYQA